MLCENLIIYCFSTLNLTALPILKWILYLESISKNVFWGTVILKTKQEVKNI